MSTENDLSFHQREDVQITWTLSPVADITGWTLQFAVRQAVDGPVLILKSTSSGITITDGPGGAFRLDLADADTIRIAPGLYLYDVARIDSGNHAVLSYGTLTLQEPMVPWA
jgi:hypothetical protein